METLRYSRMCWMSYFLLATIVSVSCQLDPTTDTAPEVDCELDHDKSNEQLSRCLNTGKNFLDSYLKSLRKKKNERFDTCGEFSKFEECISPLLEKCPAISQQLRNNWTPIVEQLKCACSNGSSEVCRENVECFESEYKSRLSERCHDMYRFNMKQQTRHRCHFLDQKIHCTYGLVDSRCGSQAGDFAFHVARQSELDQILRGHCRITQNPDYPTFRYDQSCPQTFLTDMDKCLHENLQDDNMLYFNGDNDLVVDGNAKDVKKACSAFKKYRHCTRPIRKECKSGTALAFQYMETLRTYNMKLNYICGDNKTVYVDNLQCYKEVVSNKTLMQCDNIWSDLRPLLDNITAQEFYCRADSRDTIKLQSEIDRLTSCYKEVFSVRCGNPGGEVLSELIKMALQDPFYLRFVYKPICENHEVPATPEQPDHRHLDRTARPPSNHPNLKPNPKWTTKRPLHDQPKPNVGGSVSKENYQPGSAPCFYTSTHPVVVALLVTGAAALNYLRT